MEREEQRQMRHLAREVISGKPLSEVEVWKYPGLRESLAESKEKAVELGQIGRIKAIQAILTEMNAIEKRNKRQQRALEPTRAKQASGPSPRDVELTWDDLMSSGDVDSVEATMVPHLVKYSKRAVEHLVAKHQFVKAQDYQDMRLRLEANQRNRVKIQGKRTKHQRVIRLLEKAEAKLAMAKEDYENELNKWEDARAEALEKLEAENQKELDEFDNETQGPLPAFSKTFSSQLWDLKTMQRSMVKARRFKDAGVVFEKVNELQDAEMEVIEDKYMRTREARRQVMLELHQNRVNYMKERFDTERVEIATRNEKIIEALQRTVNNWEQRLGLIIDGSRAMKAAEPNIKENNWKAGESSTKRTPRERKLARRQPWNMSACRASTQKMVSEISEPLWKSSFQRAITNTETSIQPSKSQGNSSIRPRGNRFGEKSVTFSLQKSSEIKSPETKKHGKSEKSSVGTSDFQFTGSDSAPRTGKNDDDGITVASRKSSGTQSAKTNIAKSYMPETGTSKSKDVVSVRMQAGSGKGKAAKNTEANSFSGLTFTQRCDARRAIASQTKSKIGIAELVGEKSEFEKFCDSLPPTRKHQNC